MLACSPRSLSATQPLVQVALHKSLPLKALYHSITHANCTHIYRDFFFFPAATAGRRECRAQQHRQAAQIK